MRMHDPARQPARTDRGLAILLLSSVASAVAGGAALGAVVGPLGVAWGLLFGLGFGVLVGKGLAREERARAERTRMLDDIIGITDGSLGVAPESLVSPAGEPSPEAQRWLAEWMTPPPPKVC